jgi:molecular chaperone DnaK (HSP70)
LQEFEIAPVTVVTDFLRSVLEITKASMESTCGAQWVRSSAVEYVLTVPAIWSDAAKALMIDAAEKAGFGTHREDFNFIGEPESAAAYTIRASQPGHLNVSVLPPPYPQAELIGYRSVILLSSVMPVVELCRFFI